MTPAHTQAMDTAKFSIFLQNDGAFLGSLLCNMDIVWDEKIPTACTDGLTIKFNPGWFMSLPEETRPTILLHELWHVGHLHIVRGQGLEKMRYNRACDYVINLQLYDENNSFKGTTPLLDMKWRRMSSEEVYDQLPNDPMDQAAQRGCWSDNPDDEDMDVPEDASTIEDIVQTVHVAVIAQQRTGYSSAHVDAISEIIKQRNAPQVNWKAELKDFSQDKARAGLDYKKRNRRYNHVILPARGKRGRLIELAYFMDVSGSVSTGMAEQMSAEIAYIWGTLKPKKLHIIQFDTRIHKVDTWTEGRPFNQIEIIGRGGTSLTPVADWLEEHRPAGAVIMTDLDCGQMRKVANVPILWLCINNPGATVQQGKLIHIEVLY